MRYTARFERVGDHRPGPLAVTTEAGNSIAEQVHAYAISLLPWAKAELQVDVDEPNRAGKLWVGTSSAGRFSLVAD